MDKKLAIAVIIVAFIFSLSLSYFYFSKKAALTKSLSTYVTPKAGDDTEALENSGPKTEECPINGQMLTKAQRDLWEKRRPLVVMIENSLDARPQSGLTSADVVYEAVAEGGITRFATVFYCKDSVKLVGPVRSARVYFIDLASGYGEYPLYVHVGGANCNKETGSGCANGAPADALGKLDKLGWVGYNDLNFPPFPVMWRDYNRLPNVATEHTVYSSTQKLWDYAAKTRKLTNVDEDGKKWNANFIPWKFKDDQPAANPSKSISFDFWNGKNDYSVMWQYDKTSNAYLRFNGGKAHIDKNTGKQIKAKNVIIAFAKESEANDGYDAGEHMLYKVIGEGDAIVFQDGRAIKGSWQKETATDQMTFYDTTGKEIKLNRGQDFVEIVPVGNTVEY